MCEALDSIPSTDNINHENLCMQVRWEGSLLLLLLNGVLGVSNRGEQASPANELKLFNQSLQKLSVFANELTYLNHWK